MPVAPRRLVRFFALVFVSVLAIATTAASPVQDRRAKIDAHAAARLPVILAALRQAAPEAVLLGGNSHAAFAGETRSSGCSPLVNAAPTPPSPTSPDCAAGRRLSP